MEKVTDLDFRFDRVFIPPLDTLCYNVGKDWDFVILVTGDGQTRTGKTTWACQIGKYCSYRLGKPFGVDNICFGADNLIEKAKLFPPGSVLIDDESREEFSATRQLDTFNKRLMDFFNECGIYNHIIILVATDFFDFNKNIAITRSEYLFNVKRAVSSPITIDTDDKGHTHRVVKLLRGHVDFFDRKSKRKFYLEGKKAHNDYEIGSRWRTFWGNFEDHKVIDQETYEKKKLEYLSRDRKEAKKASVGKKEAFK